MRSTEAIELFDTCALFRSVARRIDREELISAGSPEEIEIRAGYLMGSIERRRVAENEDRDRDEVNFLLRNHGHFKTRASAPAPNAPYLRELERRYRRHRGVADLEFLRMVSKPPGRRGCQCPTAVHLGHRSQ